MSGRTIIDFIDDPALLGRWFAGPSWDRWRAVLRAAFALPMSDRDLALFHEVAGDRAPPRKPVRTLVVAVGRGGGKDSVASALAAYIAATGDFTGLRAGERGTVLTLANDRDQAGIAFGFVRGYFVESAVLASLVERETADEVHLTTGASILVSTANVRAPRGRTIACAIYDECAFWRSDDSANPDSEIDAAVTPGLLRFPGSLKILISSVNKRSGLLYDKVVEFHGKDSDEVLVIKGTSRQFNPTLDATEIERELERDPERAAAEYLSEWRSDIGVFLDRELVEAAVDRGVVVRPPQAGVSYVAFADPSGGRGDSFTIAIAHDDGGTVYLDLTREWRAPFDPATVVAEIAALLRSYGIASITGDRYSAAWVVEAFAKVGIAYRQSDRDKSAIYLDALPLFATGRPRLIDNARLAYQLVSLERHTGRGRDRVDHPGGGADDLANAAAGALVLAAMEAAPSLIRREALMPVEGQDEPLPRLVNSVTATVVIAPDLRCGVVYMALPVSPREVSWILDYGQPWFSADLFGEVSRQLDEFAEGFYAAKIAAGHAPKPVSAWLYVPGEHQPTALEAMREVFGGYADLPRCLQRNVECRAFDEEIDRFALADGVRLAQAAAAPLSRARMQMGRRALERMATLPLGIFSPGDHADPITQAMWVSAIIQFGDPQKSSAPSWPGARMVAA